MARHVTRQLPIVGARLDLVVAPQRDALQALVRAALERSERPYPPNTQRAYVQAWDRWADWCDARGVTAYTPVDPIELLGMLEGMDRAGLKVNTLGLTLSAISAVDTWMRTEAGADPMAVRSHPRLKRWFKAFRQDRAEDPIKQAPALLRPELVHVLAELAKVEARRGIATTELEYLARRDHAMILLGWFGAYRTEVIARLRVADIEVDAEGIDVLARKSKTRQAGAPRRTYLYAQSFDEVCPRAQWLRWLELRGPVHPEDPAFPSRSGARMAPSAVSEAVQRRCAAAGYARFSGHSLRAGLATWAKLAGKSEADIRRHGDWQSDSVLRYFHYANSRDGNPTKGLM